MTESAERTDAFFRREQSAGVVTLTLQNSKSRNSLSLAMIDALYIEIARLKSDASARAVVLAADGPAFSAGHDLKEILAHRNDRDQGEEFYAREMARCSDLMLAIMDLRKPVIAAVEGVATAAGCQLVATCDLAIAGDKRASPCPASRSACSARRRLVAVGRAISRKHAMEMALTGDLYSAADALRFGLVNRVVPAGEALKQAQALAAPIAARSAASVALGKRDVLSADRQVDRRSLRARRTGDGRQSRPGRRRRRHRRLPGKAAAKLGRPLSQDQEETYTDDAIRAILSSVKRIAMVGASNNAARPSYFVLKYLASRGYEMLPVNPGLAGGAILGHTVYRDLQRRARPDRHGRHFSQFRGGGGDRRRGVDPRSPAQSDLDAAYRLQCCKPRPKRAAPA